MKHLVVRVFGRPAPQGSYDFDGTGKPIPASRFLPAWRTAVRRYAMDRVIRACGTATPPLPYLDGPVVIERLTFYVPRPDNPSWEIPAGPPDVDKYLRSTLDGLTKAKVYADDARVTDIRDLSKRYATAEQPPGAYIEIREWEESDQ